MHSFSAFSVAGYFQSVLCWRYKVEARQKRLWLLWLTGTFWMRGKFGKWKWRVGKNRWVRKRKAVRKRKTLRSRKR